MDVNHIYLKCSIYILDFLRLWPRNLHFSTKEYSLLGVICLATLPLKIDVLFQYFDNEVTFKNLVEMLIAICALYGVIYSIQCFAVKKMEIKALIKSLSVFEKYTPIEDIIRTEKTVDFYTKCFIIYGIVGNIFYALSPFLSYKNCLANKSHHMIKYGISCGLITTQYLLPFKFDRTPLMQLVMIEQFLICCFGTIVIMTLTMLLIGILMNCTTHLQHLKSMILESSKVDSKNMIKHVNFCVEFHTAIIEYTERVNNSFSVMMLLHICGTSFILSVLGFGILIETDYSNSVRFAMHLAGWLGMLFLVCHYGQTLMDRSFEVSLAAYDTLWYESTPKVRQSLCLILLRAQRPLVLKAHGINIMSLATFLGVMSSSYSYFTLLLYVKP